MEKFNCLVVEDEPLAAEILQDYIAQLPFLACTAVCRDAIYAIQVIQAEKIDLIFLDIHLPRIKGLDFLKTLKDPPQVIITTAYREYAIDGYELNVVDYLLKPIHFNRFVAAVNKLRHKQANSEVPMAVMKQAAAQPFLLININKKRIKIFEKDILFIESRREYVSIVTTGQSYLTKSTLTDMELQLPKNAFLRIHRSYLVAIDKLTAFNAVSVEIAEQKLPVGRNYREMVQSVLSPMNDNKRKP